MAALHEALQCLGPSTWDEIPQTQDSLRAYLRDIAHKAQLIVDSIPEPPPPSNSNSVAKHHETDSSHRHTHPKPPYQISTSSARLGTKDENLLALQRTWGKPLKPGNARDNPHAIPLYKLHAQDGKASWFGRRSVHEGMPFSRWKEKLSSELEETLRGNERKVERGLAPDCAVRGLGAARKVEEVEVLDEDGDEDGDGSGKGKGRRVLGVLRVYDNCAHFPKPTTPRDFVQVNVSWEDGARAQGGEQGERRCRSWLSVSKPCVHPDLPARDGYIRGQYESVEFIREVILPEEDKGVTSSDPNLVQHEVIAEDKKDTKKASRPKTDSATREKNEEQNDTVAGGDVDDDEVNPFPVEWTMVTRSDPGGSIPRWVIEKGTPKSIWGDTVKLLDWACRDQEETSTEADKPGPQASVHEKEQANANDSSDNESLYPEEQRNGLIANFAYLFNAGIERYAPRAILDYVPYHQPASSDSDENSDSDVFDDAVSIPSSTDSTSKKKHSTSQDKPSLAGSSHSDIDQNIAPVDVVQMEKKGKLTSQEKQLVKLAERKRDVQAKLEAARAEIEALRLDAGAPAGAPGGGGAAAAVGAPVSKEEKKKQEKERKEREKQEKEKRDREKKERGRQEKERKDREKKERKEKERERKENKQKDGPQEAEKQERPSTESSQQSDRTSTDTKPRPSSTISNSQQQQQQQQHQPPQSQNQNQDQKHDPSHLHKTASGLFTQESKLLKQLTKIEREQLKLASKVEARQHKHVEREERTRARGEVEVLKKEVEGLKKEVERLRGERGQWVELLAGLQGENEKLAGDGRDG